jgi:murein DD-endopeptidase MepM/ murein hydrolase activator NlpD
MTLRNYLKPLIAAMLLLLPCASLKANGACDAAPLPEGSYRLSSPFGMRVHPIDHVWRMHYGLDLACPRGTRVSAVADGVVLFAGSWGCYGKLVILGHPGDVITVYAHLSRIKAGLRRGVCVKAGQVIGLTGATGCVTGPHLHIEVWTGKERRRVNPAFICAALPVTRKGVKPWHRL